MAQLRINEDTDIRLVEEEESIWITAGPSLAVKVTRTVEGVIVDVWPTEYVNPNAVKPVATCGALFAEAYDVE